jgi:hypothetical protein
MARACSLGEDAILHSESAKMHRALVELSLEPLVMKGDQHRKFLKDNEQSTKELMGW